jgi:hypothetical protein
MWQSALNFPPRLLHLAKFTLNIYNALINLTNRLFNSWTKWYRQTIPNAFILDSSLELIYFSIYSVDIHKVVT